MFPKKTAVRHKNLSSLGSTGFDDGVFIACYGVDEGIVLVYNKLGKTIRWYTLDEFPFVVHRGR